MKMKKYELFGGKYYITCKYDLLEVNSNIIDLMQLRIEISKPQILKCNGLGMIDFDIESEYIGRDCIKWLYKRNKAEIIGMGDFLLRISTEDNVWIEDGILYRKIILNPEMQEQIKIK